MRKIAGTLLFLLLLSTLARAAVLSVEFKFTPFVGDPASAEKVTTVPGKAAIFLNNMPFSEQEVKAEELPVAAEDQTVSPALGIPASSVGPVVRKGKNKIRIEFTPEDMTRTYRAQLRWNAITDDPAEDAAPGGSANDGVDDRKEVQGKVIFEREFTADFALDLPWHHYPAVTSLTEEDKQKIAALLKTRADWFQGNFADLYKALEDNESLKVDDVRKARCLETVYEAGVRVTAPQAGELDFATTNGPEVVVRKKAGALFGLDDKMFAAIKDEQIQMCAGMALSVVYPGRLVVVRRPDGAWEVVY